MYLYKKQKINLFRESIYNYFEQLLVEKGITAIQYTDFPSIQRLAQILSKRIKNFVFLFI